MSVLLHFFKWRLGFAKAEVWTTAAEGDCLVRYAAGKRRLAEVGVWHGGTSRQLRSAMANDGVLFAVDPYEKGRLGFSIPRIVGTREVARVHNGSVVWIRQNGAEAARSPEILGAAPLDFVFIDNAQTFETLRIEWEAWSPLIAEGGIIALHDSHGSDEQSSVRYAREVVLIDPRYEALESVDSLTILQRRRS
jgi:predicted O-methyltransferase YrrM